MRKELEPNWDVAEELYSAIKDLIEKYTEYCDENGDDDLIEYQKLENKLHLITGKDMSEYNFLEWWEGEGIEVLSFRIALPKPNDVHDITKEELTEILRRIKEPPTQCCDGSFKDDFCYHAIDYYHELLKLNFKKYKHKFFHRQKGNDGKYFEYTAEEIAEKIWH
jgi:hypothetical protein